ncbi:lytic transglycosylase domain-containing protein [Paenibacillus sp. MAHUQ-46]|uniref:Lytic transglycosylase domain-containing protein n=1 Tax=Paenibacillus roseus TaxID=2798579 RepID=A0A934MSB9_9BACL|nr:lytic transglycosylase domain-containing protein [Paenibacillus roseus]MBJ6363773.1 lytic transglycosylase domain-containing protein [Paenibacillus roseus]
MRMFRKKRFLLLLFIGFIILLFARSDWMGRWMYPIYYIDDIKASSLNYEVDPYLVAAIIRAESNFETGRESPKGALGIMQIMPDTAGWIASKANFTNLTLDDIHHRADISIQMGTWYIKSLERQFKERRPLVIAAYNAGPGKVNQWLKDNVWDGELDTAHDIPYGETRRYVQKVIYYYNKYKELYPSF